MQTGDRVAIVGMAIRFPGAGPDLEQFWTNVRTGVDASREVPAGRWALPADHCFAAGGPQPDAVYSTRGYYLDPFTADIEGLAVPADFLAALDPLFHLVLDVGHRAWKSAKIANLDRRKVGVILGNICLPTDKASDLAREFIGFPRPLRTTHPLNRYVAGLPAGLLAKALGLGGGTFTLDAACASSLYAIKLACDELLAGRADAMLAGGANRPDSLYTQMGFAQLRALSPSGKCSPFDAAADGLMVGEGAGVFVLKRLSDALTHGDKIHAVITGIGLSNDTEGNLLAPAKEGQLRAIRTAYAAAEWAPHVVDLIECHATGTPVGDAVEFGSLRDAWGATGWRPGQCTIGSVKSTVGHLLTGAGTAAITKTLLAMANGIRPPQANFVEPAASLPYANGPFRVLTNAEPWDRRGAKTPRRAAISGFGFGGVNGHLLLEEFLGQSYLPPVAASKLQTVSTRRIETPTSMLAVPPPEPIAVIGLATHVGPWETLQAFQEMVLGGVDRPEPRSRTNGWDAATSPVGYFIGELTVPLDRFRIPPRELEELLPQQLLMLLTAAAALDDAKAKLADAPDPRTGVFIGLGLDLNTTNFHVRWTTSYEQRAIIGPPLTADRTMGALGSIAASRIARAFRFGGPSFTVCSEESSAGQAIALAVRALRAKEIDRAVVGGIELAGDPRALIPADALKPGTTPGEGAAAFVFKRLTDAQRDGDRVYAVIRGVGVASGGAVEGVGPDSASYASALMRACADGVIDPTTIELLEASATGATGDDGPEAEAFAALLAARDRSVPLTVGRVRTQVGAVGAAGSAVGLVKACLALYHQILPPSAGFATVTDRCHTSKGPRYWAADANAPRRAVVAATGIDGSVVHLVLEECAKTPAADLQPLGARSEAIFAVEADTPAELNAKLGSLAEWLTDRPIEFLARAWFAAHPPAPTRRRAVVLVARSLAELHEQIRFARESLSARIDAPFADPRPHLRDRVFYAPQPLGPKGKIAFVYPGSGNQYAGMGQALAAHFPAILRVQQAENQRLRRQFAPDKFWADAIPPETTAKEFLFGQVALGTLTSDLLISLGVRADALIGQSLGESAGLFGLRVWRNRDEMLDRVRKSTLFGSDLGPPFDAARIAWTIPAEQTIEWVSGVLPIPADEIRSALRPGLRAYLLIVTTPTECVIGGLRADVERLVAQFRAPFFPLQGVTLAHCEAGKPVEQPYRELHTLPTTPPKGLNIYSGAFARTYKPKPATCADSITAGLLETIDFPKVVNAAYKDGIRIFLEVGPGNSCTRMIAAILGDKPHVARAVTATRQDEVSLVLRLVAHLMAERAPVDLNALYAGPARCVGHRDRPAHAGNCLTIPVGLPPREVPMPAPASVIDASVEPEPVPVVVEFPEPRKVDPPLAEYAPAWASGLAPYVTAALEAQVSAAIAHETFLRVQSEFVATTAAALDLHSGIIARLLGQTPDDLAPSSAPSAVPRSLDLAACFTFARGKLADVLGPTFAAIDAHPTRVRLPDGPLMLVDRILSIEGEPRSLTRGRVVTEHHVHAGRWYLDAGRIPTCVAVEAGQADLFLSAFLGIDFETHGLAVYRLIDAVVTFHRPLPVVGETIVYDIHIDQFLQQGDAWLFRFRFEATVNGEPLMSMANGVAGFFTAAAIAAGQGIVHTKLDKQAIAGKKPADWQDLVPLSRGALGKVEIDALRRGDLVTAFGNTFATAKLTAPAPLPGGMLRLLDRVPVLDPAGGRFGIGFVRAEYDIAPDDWFLTCHFIDDQVMPGTLMYECCLHTLRVLLMRLGWVGEAGEFACEPVPGIASRLKCRGQVIATTQVVAYEVSIKELGYGPAPYCIADALMYADGKPIVEISNMTLRMSGLTLERLQQIWPSPRITSGTRATPLYDSAKIMAYSNGKPSEAFGPQYQVFDHDRKIARLPGPPYQFLDRVIAVTGEPFALKAGAACVCEYDVPRDAWYFAANRCGRIPFSVLLEIALQPCGWLAAYCGSALTSPTDLSFRNLGGSATQHRPVGPDIGTLTVEVTMTNVSTSAGMIIQHYSMKVSAAAELVYQGTTYFGFFAKDALANQVGMPTAKVPYLAPDQKVPNVRLPQGPPFPDKMLRMVDRIDGYLSTGGAAGLGLVQGSVTVDPSFWFFAAHFYQDPVWPGSLGVESFLQLLKYVAWKRWGDPPSAGWQTVVPGHAHDWTYRGQVLPTDREVIVVLEITAVDETARRLTAAGFLTVDGRVIYQMAGFTLQ